MFRPASAVRRLFFICVTTAAIAGCSDDDRRRDDGFGPAPGGGDRDGFQLQLLHFADMDGATAALDHVSNFSRLVNAFSSVDDLQDNTLVLSSGDNFIPGPRYFASGALDDVPDALGEAGNGRADIVFVNRLGTAASALGNHDLDPGTATFADLIANRADRDYPGAAFPFLSSNADFSDDSNLSTLAADNGQSASEIAGRVAGSASVSIGGERIGVVGASTPLLANITQSGGIDMSPDDFPMNDAGYNALAAAIQPAIDALVDDGVDKIVVVSHMQQIAIEQALATRLNDVDIIIAGGSNTLLADSNDILRDGDSAADTYPLSYEGPDQTPTLLVNVDGDYRYLGRLVVSFDEDGVLVTESLDTAVNGAWASIGDVVGMLSNRGLNTDADDQVLAIQAALQDVLAEQDGNVQGITDVYLDGRRSQVRTEETNLGNLTADANLFYARLADESVTVSLKNGGGIRQDIGQVVVPAGSNEANPERRPPQENASIGKPTGGLSQFAISGALRFNNSLTLISLTPGELLDIMEYAVAATEPGATPGQFPQIGGMRITFDPENQARMGSDSNQGASTNGNRIREIVLLDDDGNDTATIVSSGRVVDNAPDRIRIVLLNFLAQCIDADYLSPADSCGDGYPLNGLSDPRRDDLNPEIQPGRDTSAYNPNRSSDLGAATFAEPGTEQDALAEYLQVRFTDTDSAFDRAETSAAQDMRIGNLKARRDAMNAIR